VWKRDLALLADQHRQLRRAVAALGAAALRDARQVRLIRGAAPPTCIMAARSASAAARARYRPDPYQ